MLKKSDLSDLSDLSESPHVIPDGYSYWKNACGEKSMPCWSDINPAKIKHLLPNIVIIQVVHDPLDFIEKITGDAILSRSVGNSMGKNWRDYEGRGPGSKIWTVFENVVRQKQASFNTIPYVGLHKEFMEIETVVLPISENDETVSRIICFVDYVPFSKDPTIKKFHQKP